VIAAFFLWKGNVDGLFISSVAGAVCFFLSVRFQVKERMEKRANAAVAPAQTQSSEENAQQDG
jgi:hypothetical protein